MLSATAGIILCLLVLFTLLLMGAPIFICLLLSGMIGLVSVEGWQMLNNVAGKIAFSHVSGYSLLAVPMFIFMGNLLLTHRIGQDLYDGMYRWFGRLPGGLAIASTIVCAIFGFMSGSNTAASATIGSIAIPEMEKKKYDRKLSLGTLAVAGTLAALIPPSTIMIIYGVNVSGISIGEVFVGGIIPGLILTGLMSLYIFIVAKISPKLAPAGTSYAFKDKVKLLPRLVPVGILFVAIVGGMYMGVWTAIEASAASVFISIIIIICYRRLSAAAVWDAVKRTVKISGMIYMIIIGANVMSYLFFVTGFQDAVSKFILHFSLPPWGTMLLILFIMTILGTFLDVIALITISVPIFLPLVTAAGYSDVWFGVIVTVASEMALCTPPVGVNLFVIQGIAPRGTTLLTVAKGAAPFIGVIWVLLVLLVAFPGLVTWLPGTMGAR
ncbi:MAG: TRAP transporter large permease [Thermodesulfobacteriota bacterium]